MMAKESPLIEIHRHNGARFREEDGWAMPIHFGEPLQEYEAARSQVGLFDLCHHSLLRFTGADRVSFLHGMVSNEVKALVPGKGIYAAFLDVNGKILADTRVFCTGDSFLVDLWEPLKEKILAHLNRYLIADEVEIADLTAQYGMISLQGSKAELLLKELLRSEKVLSGELDHGTFQSGNAELRVIRSTRTGQEGYDLIIAVKDLAAAISRIQEIGKKFSLQWVGAQAQEILRIERGIPRYGFDMDETNLLLETGLDESVSFQKGCYLGQEVIERIHSRGHVNKKLVGIVLDGERPAGRNDSIRVDGEEIGKITSSVFSPALKRPIALGYVHRRYTDAGTSVSIDRNGIAIPAVVSSLPFHRSSA